jgi:signal peptidase II
MKKFPKVEMIVFGIVLFLDQVSKAIVSMLLAQGQSATVIPDWIYITHTHNTGTIWGIAQGGNLAFTIIAIAVVILIIFLAPKITTTLASKICLGAILGGAIGNLADRIFRGYVVDFIEFRIIKFPVFNVADIGIVCGAIALAAIMLFSPKCD